MDKVKIRRILKRDNAAIEQVIRSCLIEFGADHEGTAWADPDLGQFYEVYQAAQSAYWVAEHEDGTILGGAGIAPLDARGDVCELQKMYLLPEARGQGIAQALMASALDFAKRHYRQCYLETLDNMVAAQRLYEAYGFERVTEPVARTEHFACDVRYLKSLDGSAAEPRPQSESSGASI